jgi:large subunit ribosomal protein L18
MVLGNQRKDDPMGHIHESLTERRARRVRHKLKTLNPGSLRLSVHRSNLHFSAQIIDDTKGQTLASASTMEKAVAKGLKNTRSADAAQKVGEMLAERAKKAGVTEVYFDRGHLRYTGRLKTLADAARAGGLKF